MTHNKKLPITEEVVLNIFDDIFNINTMDELLKFRFTIEDLVNKNAVKKWKNSGYSEFLRKYIKVSECSLISEKKLETLKEKQITSILRVVLKKFGYKLLLFHNTHGSGSSYVVSKPAVEDIP